MAIKELKVRPLEHETKTLPTEEKSGLRYAVVHCRRDILGVFGTKFWAEEFIKHSGISSNLTVYEVVD